MRILTKDQFKQIVGKSFTKDSYFNPVLDADGEIVISEEEVTQCDVSEFNFVKELPQKDFNPVIISTNFGGQ